MEKSAVRILLRSSVIAYVLTAVLLLLLAFGLYQFHLLESQVTLGIRAIYVIACFFAGFAAGKTAGNRRFLWGLAAGILYFLILLAVSFLISRQITSDTTDLLISFLSCAIGGMAGGMIS